MSIEMTYNTIFMYDCIHMTYITIVQKFPLTFQKKNFRKTDMAFGTLRYQVEKLAYLFACWHTKLKHWYVVQHVDTFIDMVVRKNQRLARFQHSKRRMHVNTLACEPHWQTSTLTRRPRRARKFSKLNLNLSCLQNVLSNLWGF